MSNKISPPVQKSLNLLEKVIATCITEKSNRLPSIIKLAKTAGVSKATMSKAVDILKKKEMVTCFPGQGIFINKLQNDADEKEQADIENLIISPEPHSASERVQLEMEKAILNGEYPPGQLLPQPKELQEHYGVSFPTLKKALNICVSASILERYHRRYKVPSMTGSQSNSRIGLLVPHEPITGPQFVLETFYDTCRKHVEESCARTDINLDLITQTEISDSVNLLYMDSGKEYNRFGDPLVLGFIMLLRLYDDMYERQLVELAQYKKPIAILDVTGNLSLKPYLKNNPNIKVFTMSVKSNAGTKIARYLLQLGHKNIAYLSPFHSYDWSQFRLDAIKNVFTTAGCKVVPFVNNSFTTRREFLKQAYARVNMENLNQSYNKWKTGIPYEYTSQLDPAIAWATYDMAIRGELYLQMLPLFREAMADKEITAWVTANDLVASMARDYCMINKIAIPQDISLISFDNTLEALKNHVTSFSFNIPAVVQAMIEHVLQPESVIRFQRRRIVDIEGSLIIRSSTGKPL